MPTSTLTTKGQVTIPKEIRDRMALHPGDVLEFRFDDKGKVVMEPLTDEPLERLSGLLSHLAPEKPISIDDMRTALRNRARKKAEIR